MIRYETTPNPNALKCVTDSTIVDGIRSYRKPEDADDELSRSILAIEGVRSLLINGNWLTVNKADDASWKAIKAGIEAVLGER
jgi:hypothetical protein